MVSSKYTLVLQNNFHYNEKLKSEQCVRKNQTTKPRNRNENICMSECVCVWFEENEIYLPLTVGCNKH